jgi:hypothetical protein
MQIARSGYTVEMRELLRVFFIYYGIEADTLDLGMHVDDIVKKIDGIGKDLRVLKLKRELLVPAIKKVYPDITDEFIENCFTRWNPEQLILEDGDKGGAHIWLRNKMDQDDSYVVSFDLIRDSVKPFEIKATGKTIRSDSPLGRDLLCVALMRSKEMVSLETEQLTPFAERLIDNLPPAATIH